MYFIGDTKDVFTPKVFLGSGHEGKVYYNEDTNEAVKIHKNNELNRISLNEATAKILSGIPTTNILMPKRIVYDENGNFAGYTTHFIQKEEDLIPEMLQKAKIRDILKVLEPLYNDARNLSMQSVNLRDIRNENNHLYNGNFYLIDPGLYRIEPRDKMEILKENFGHITYIIDINIFAIRITNIQERLAERGDYYTYCDYLRDEGRPGETFASLARRKG